LTFVNADAFEAHRTGILGRVTSARRRRCLRPQEMHELGMWSFPDRGGTQVWVAPPDPPPSRRPRSNYTE
jgi:hypothetical protein